jgi:hypothetical protein
MVKYRYKLEVYLMYIKRNREELKQLKVISIEDLVPQDHILRQIDASIDFSFIYDEVKGLYSELEWGKTRNRPCFTV